MKQEQKNILWYTLAFMAFSTVWSFGNVVNGFSEYGGLKAIISWIIIFSIYFIPYSLMVGELGSAFKSEGGGVSSWINATVGPTLAYYAGWTYWVVHMPYISQKPSRVLISLSWIIFGDKRISDANVLYVQIASLIIFFIVLYLASKGVNFVKKIASVAGTSMFVMSLLFIVLAISAPSITGAKLNHLDLSLKNIMPVFDLKFLMNLSILVFAVGGCEKISPYVNKMKSPARDFPKGMITLVIMVATTAILGTIALGLFFDSNNIPKDLMTNGTYYAFQKLGQHYGMGNTFMIVYAIAEFLGQVSVMVISIDAPLRILLESSDSRFIPKSMMKQNKYGAYTNGHKLIAVIISILIIIPAFGIKDVDALIRWLVKLNAVCMPLRYLWVFFAYFALKKAGEKFPAEYRLTKNKLLGYIIAIWCFLFTLVACILGMYSQSSFELIINILTPFALILLGLIMPRIAKKQLERGY
ncbi:MAG: amino acid permease [Peptoniphilaceae bacterium]